MFNRKSKAKLDVLYKRVKNMWDGEEPAKKSKKIEYPKYPTSVSLYLQHMEEILI